MIRSMKVRKLTVGMLLVLAGAVSGCGTFFPKAPAERAADKVLDDVFPAKEPAGGNDSNASVKKP